MGVTADGGIAIVHPDGSGERELLVEPTNVIDLLRAGAWSPDGATIVFSRYKGNDTGEPTPINVFTVAVDGSGVTKLTDDGISADASWSPDGTHLILTKGDGTSNYRIYAMNADGSGAVPLTDGHTNDFWPASPPVAHVLAT